MSDMNSARRNIESELGKKTFFARIMLRIRLFPQKKLLLASCLLHVIFFSLLFINWHSKDHVKEIYIPQSIQAHVVSQDEIKSLQAKKNAEKKAIQDALEREKKLIEARRKELKEKALAKKKAKEAELKKIAAQKKKEAEKILQIKKQKEENARKEKEKKLKDLEQKQLKEAEQKKQAEAEKLLADKQLAEERALEIKKQESRLLEKLKQIEHQKELAAQQAQELADANERKRKEQEFLDYELTEQERYMARIKTQIEGLWRIPPKSDRLKITVSIRLLPNGELSAVNILNSSGNDAFDRSAILAIKSVRRFLVPEDNLIFERNFRQFNMSFSPE